MTPETKMIKYYGPPSRASALVQELEANGVEVQWQPPEESRDAGSAIEGVAVALVSTGALTSMRIAVDAFRKRLPRAKVEIEGDASAAEVGASDLVRVGDVVAIGTIGGDCPVGLVTAVDGRGIRLDLYSWLISYFSAGVRVVLWPPFVGDDNKPVAPQATLGATGLPCGTGHNTTTVVFPQ